MQSYVSWGCGHLKVPLFWASKVPPSLPWPTVSSFCDGNSAGLSADQSAYMWPPQRGGLGGRGRAFSHGGCFPFREHPVKPGGSCMAFDDIASHAITSATTTCQSSPSPHRLRGRGHRHPPHTHTAQWKVHQRIYRFVELPQRCHLAVFRKHLPTSHPLPVGR